MNFKIVSAGGIGLLLTGLVASAAAQDQAEPDFTSLPPKPADIEQQVVTSQVSLAQAVATAQAEVGGLAKSAVMLLDETPPAIDILVYADGRAHRVLVDAMTGEVSDVTEIPRLPGEPAGDEWTETESGLKYYDLRVGDGPQPPDEASFVKTHLAIWFVTGDQLVNSRDLGEPFTFALNQIPVTGLTEGIMGMNVGGLRKLIVPYNLAYGEQVDPRQGMPPKATLICDVELLALVDYSKLPDELPGLQVEGEPITTDSGLMYYDMVIGDGPMPESRSEPLTLHFRGYTTDGTEIISTYDLLNGKPQVFAMDGMFPMYRVVPEGFAEGVMTMAVGGTRKLVIPNDLAYGEQTTRGIPAKAILIFDIQLLPTVDYSTMPDVLPGEPVEGEPVTTLSGLMYYDMVVGDGPSPADLTTEVKVHYTGWLNDGTKFDSSYDGGTGEPSQFALNRVIAGWKEGVASMRVGGKRKLIIPYDLGYGESGSRDIPPKALLVFDIELVEVVRKVDTSHDIPAAPGGGG
ncbi:MAG: FKBP-type peptidyl-prolyl cis-trans isomerase [Phycisphaerales bacterium]|nr:FKBP-type peptidyl-prolyl cis-trans isomerase [Phycisphaerales bacterium]